MELIISSLDKGLVPTYGMLGTVLRVIAEVRTSALNNALGHLDAELEDLSKLAQWYHHLPKLNADEPAGVEAITVLSYLVGACGLRTDRDRAGLELVINKDLAAQFQRPPTFAFPCWIPAVVAPRKLLFPMVAPTRTSVLEAYEGLVNHVCNVSEHSAEVAQTAILWRVIAISDGLVEGVTRDRQNILRNGIFHDESLYDREKDTWDVLNEKFINYRDAASHMTAKHPFTGTVQAVFCQSAEYARTSFRELLLAASAMGLAVVRDVAACIEDLPPPIGEWAHCLREHGWVDEHL